MAQQSSSITRESIREEDAYINYPSNRDRVSDNMNSLMEMGQNKEVIKATLKQAELSYNLIEIDTDKLLETYNYNISQNNHKVCNKLNGLLFANDSIELRATLGHLVELSKLAKKLDALIY